MDYYEILKFVHIAMAIVWVGGATVIQIFVLRIMRESDDDRLAKFSRDVGWIGERIFLPASLILVVMGILMVVDAWDFSDTWIMIAIGGFLATVVTGAFFLSPSAKKLAGIVETKGAADPEFRSTFDRVILISRIDLVVLFLVVLDMVVKPGL